MRIALGIEYDGQPFFGFQTQKQQPTVQSCLEKAISHVANHDVRIFCAGRTDTGVNALQQVVHFDTEAVRTSRQWVLGVNSKLHEGVVVRWAKEVDDSFHARFSATRRKYEYRILCRSVRPAIHRHQLTWVLPPLDPKLMNTAAQYLLGKHDFSAFRSSKCQANNPIRTMYVARIYSEGEYIICQFEANAFLHHMIRNIVGTLIKVGKGDRLPQWVNDVLQSKDRKLAGMTAPPNGLTFSGVSYPDEFEVPSNE